MDRVEIVDEEFSTCPGLDLPAQAISPESGESGKSQGLLSVAWVHLPLCYLFSARFLFIYAFTSMLLDTETGREVILFD